MAASPSGAWAGHAGEIAVFAAGAWSFHAPQAGFLAFVGDEAALVVRDGSTWSPATPSALQNLTRLGLGTAAVAEIRVRIGPIREEGGWEDGLAAVASVLGIYLLTAILTDESTSTVTAFIACLAALVLARFGGGVPAIACGVLAAVVGVAAGAALAAVTAGAVGGHPLVPRLAAVADQVAVVGAVPLAAGVLGLYGRAAELMAAVGG